MARQALVTWLSLSRPIVRRAIARAPRCQPSPDRHRVVYVIGFAASGSYQAKLKTNKKFKFLNILLSLAIPILFHAFYDYFLFLDFIPGIWIGGFVTLIIAFFVAKNSIIEHMSASPFKKEKK